MKIAGLLFLTLMPLILIGIGAYLIYPPSAFIAVGGLMWIDLNIRRKIEPMKKGNKK